MSVSGANIAICFNNMEESQALAKKLNEFSPGINFIISSSFDGFLKEIAKVEKINCFIIEEKYKECQAVDLIEKLKSSQRYKKSLLALYTPSLEKIDKKYLEFDLDLTFDNSTDFKGLHANLERIILKQIMPVIPKDFNVMALDNSREMLELISMHLTELGHENFDLCHSIRNAKMTLLEKDYDLLLLDWNLDDGTCIDLIEYIRSSTVSERTKASLIVVITGRDSVDDIMTLLRYEVKDTIIKPFDFLEFEDKINYAIEKHLKRAK